MSTQNVNQGTYLVSTYVGDKNFKDEVERRCEAYDIGRDSRDGKPYLLTEKENGIGVRYTFVVPIPSDPIENRRAKDRANYMEECIFKSLRGQSVAIKME